MSTPNKTPQITLGKVLILATFVLAISSAFLVPKETVEANNGGSQALAKLVNNQQEFEKKLTRKSSCNMDIPLCYTPKVSSSSAVSSSEAQSVKEETKVIEPIKVEAPKEEIKIEQKAVVSNSIRDRNYRLNNGKYMSGHQILEYIKGNANGLKLWNAFNNEFGETVADTAGISLFYENGSLKSDSVGVCNYIHWIGGDYRNCAYADMNSAGMDVGLKQVNSFYQSTRITKLGGESLACYFRDSRDRNDPCNQKKIEWLINVDNNIAISLDIYREQRNFNAWYGYRRAFSK